MLFVGPEGPHTRKSCRHWAARCFTMLQVTAVPKPPRPARPAPWATWVEDCRRAKDAAPYDQGERKTGRADEDIGPYGVRANLLRPCPPGATECGGRAGPPIGRKLG